MINYFEKRATEYLRDDEAFLAIVSPEPLVHEAELPAHVSDTTRSSDARSTGETPIKIEVEME